MPRSIAVTASPRSAVFTTLAGIAESQAIRGANLTKDRYQLGANIAGTVACSWIRVWSQARRAGDTQTAEQAVAAMATAKHLEAVSEVVPLAARFRPYRQRQIGRCLQTAPFVAEQKSRRALLLVVRSGRAADRDSGARM